MQSSIETAVQKVKRSRARRRKRDMKEIVSQWHRDEGRDQNSAAPLVKTSVHRILRVSGPFVLVKSPTRRRDLLHNPARADQLFDVIQLGRQEVGEVLNPSFGDNDD